MGVFFNHLQRAPWKIFPWEGKSCLRAKASTKIIWNKKNMTPRFSSGRNRTAYQSLGWNIQYSGIVKHVFGCDFHMTAIRCPILSWYKELSKFNSGLRDCPDVIQRRLCGNQREASHRNTHWQKTDTLGSNAMKTVGNWRTPDCCRFVGPQVNNNRWRYSKMLRENILAARSNSSFLLFFFFMTSGNGFVLFTEIMILQNQCSHRIFHAIFWTSHLNFFVCFFDQSIYLSWNHYKNGETQER